LSITPTKTFGSPLVIFHASARLIQSNSACCFAIKHSGFKVTVGEYAICGLVGRAPLVLEHVLDPHAESGSEAEG
jgi:hypothetical protein